MRPLSTSSVKLVRQCTNQMFVIVFALCVFSLFTLVRGKLCVEQQTETRRNTSRIYERCVHNYTEPCSAWNPYVMCTKSMRGFCPKQLNFTYTYVYNVMVCCHGYYRTQTKDCRSLEDIKDGEIVSAAILQQRDAYMAEKQHQPRVRMSPGVYAGIAAVTVFILSIIIIPLVIYRKKKRKMMHGNHTPGVHVIDIGVMPPPRIGHESADWIAIDETQPLNAPNDTHDDTTTQPRNSSNNMTALNPTSSGTQSHDLSDNTTKPLRQDSADADLFIDAELLKDGQIDRSADVEIYDNALNDHLSDQFDMNAKDDQVQGKWDEFDQGDHEENGHFYMNGEDNENIGHMSDQQSGSSNKSQDIGKDDNSDTYGGESSQNQKNDENASYDNSDNNSLNGYDNQIDGPAVPNCHDNGISGSNDVGSNASSTTSTIDLTEDPAIPHILKPGIDYNVDSLPETDIF